MIRALLDQVAMGRTVTIAPVAELPDVVSVALGEGGRVVEQSTCIDDEAGFRHVIRRLAAELGA